MLDAVRRILVVYAVAVLLACWVAVVMVYIAAMHGDGTVTIDVDRYSEGFVEMVALMAAGPSIGWVLRGSLDEARE